MSVFKYHTNKTHEGVEVCLRSFLTSAISTDKWTDNKTHEGVEVCLRSFLTSPISTDKWTDLHPGTCYKERTPVPTARRLAGAQKMFRGFREEKTICHYSGTSRSVIRQCLVSARTAVFKGGTRMWP